MLCSILLIVPYCLGDGNLKIVKSWMSHLRAVVESAASAAASMPVCTCKMFAFLILSVSLQCSHPWQVYSTVYSTSVAVVIGFM